MKPNPRTLASQAPLRTTRLRELGSAALVLIAALTSCAEVDPPEHSASQPASASNIRRTQAALKFEGACTARDQRVLQAYHGWLWEYVVDANHQFSYGATGQRRTYYFNPLDEEQRSIARDRLADMRHLLETVEFTYRCRKEYTNECPDDAGRAWVEGFTRSGIVTLCPGFWLDDNQGRLLTLAHELAHFAGADMEFVDPEHVRLLAQYFPRDAVENAHNYASFVMNPAAIPD